MGLFKEKLPKVKEQKTYRVGVFTRKGIPIQVETFNIDAKNENDAEKKARKKVVKDNPDKPKRYFFVSTMGYGRKE